MIAHSNRHAIGGVTSNRRWRRWPPHLVLMVLISATAGCHNLRNQVKAMIGSDSTGAAAAGAASGSAAKPSSGGHAVMPKAYGSKPPTGILGQTFRLRPDPAERNTGPGPKVPRFDWGGHDGRLGGGLTDSPRHVRGS
jgi:hypothetical protein